MIAAHQTFIPSILTFFPISPFHLASGLSTFLNPSACIYTRHPIHRGSSLIRHLSFNPWLILPMFLFPSCFPTKKFICIVISFMRSTFSVWFNAAKIPVFSPALPHQHAENNEAMKAHGEVEVQFHAFFISVVDGTQLSDFHIGRFNPGERDNGIFLNMWPRGPQN